MEIERILRIGLTPRMKYYIIVAIIFLTMSLVAMPLLVRFGFAGREMANNISVEFLGLAITVLVLMFAIEWREYDQWRPVKDKVMKIIGREIYRLFEDFTNVCVCTHFGGMSMEESIGEFNKREFLTQLEELNEKVELNDLGKKYFIEGSLAPLYVRRAKYLSDIEARYSRFLDAPFRLSLMEIQDNLNHLGVLLSIEKEALGKTFWWWTEESFLSVISTRIHNVVKEIYKIHKMGIEIYE